ncbi:hypothetical protein [Deinococcus maricopensis]|uniref:Cyclase/dehydrase n=1 Tax=Deinococcus maricopensis (strain DSM 21211 / LMG 22137 / NRRL B-23946 / LB-34) TaxID=709986 RepID=E8U968_DEIML|nr:hypothetical protein [Deinococcus maricopensis]ADV67607.1 hypothetical protein Deima_1962 [Deinococcus maricopensis DSM 21211]
MRLTLSTTLNAPVGRVWAHVQQPALLRFVAAPLQTFEPLRPATWPARWAAGEYVVHVRVLGVRLSGTHCISVSFPDPDTMRGRERFELHDHGHGRLARTWNHDIIVQALPDGRTRYTDRVEVRAGLFTPFVWAYAQVFYRHRQRRWRQLVRQAFRGL